MEMTHKMGWKVDPPTGPIKANLVWKPGLLTASPDFKAPGATEMRIGMSAVEDQNTNDCVARAIIGGLEYLFKKSLIDKTNYFELSSRFLYYAARLEHDLQNVDGGAYLNDGIVAARDFGVPWEGMCPNDAFKVNDRPTEEAFQDPRRISLGEIGFNPDLIKACCERTPIVFGFVVYQRFYTSGVDANGFMPMPQEGEGWIGGHAACICGYNLQKKAFLVRNSWGPDWGPMGGYFWMPFEFVDRGYAANFCALKTIKSPYSLA